MAGSLRTSPSRLEKTGHCGRATATSPHCDFKGGFDRGFVKEVMKRQRAGWTIQEFTELLLPVDRPDDYEITRVVVDNITIDCHAKAKPRWQASAGDIDTASPISIAA